MNQVMKTMRNHRSIRKFADKDINKETLNSILETSQWASTSNNLQAYSVIIIKDKNKKKELAQFTGNQRHVAECQVFLVFCADLQRISLSSDIEEKEKNLDSVEPFVVSTIDTALYAQNVILSAESLGLGGVYIGGIRNNPEKVSELLHIPDYVYPAFGMCLGYPDPKFINEQKPRLPIDAIVHQEYYQLEKQEKNIIKYNNIMQKYYETRATGQRSQSWTDYVSNVYQSPKRIHLREFLEKKMFGFK